MAKQNLKNLTKQFVGKPLPQVEAVSADATAVQQDPRKKKQIGNYKKVDSEKTDFIKDYGLPIVGNVIAGPIGAVAGGIASTILPSNVKQLAAKLMGDARMSNTSLSDDQKILLWDVMQNAKKRTGKPDGGTEYQDYGGLGYGDSEQFNDWFNHGNFSDLGAIYHSLTNPGFELGSTIGRGKYFTDPENPDKMYYTDVYDWNTHEKNFAGKTNYQKNRNALREMEDPNLNIQKNDKFRMNFELDRKEIEKLKNKKELPLDASLDRNGGWLEKYNDGGPVQENYNDYSVSAPEGFQGDGYSNVGRNYSPAWGGQFQMGGSMPGAVGFTYARTINPAPSNGPYAKKTKASAQNGTWLDKGINKLYDAEDKLTKWLGNPMQRATNEAKSASYDYLGSNDDPIDSYRHSMAGNYTSKAIQDKLYNIPLVSQAAGFIGANVLGAGHEISTLIGHAPEFGGDDDRPWLDKIRESGEDAFNNMVGAGVGSIPFMSAKQKANTLLNLSLNNRLPDGHGQGNMYIKKKQNGGEMRYYQDGLDFKPKSISKNGSKVIKDDMGQWAHPGEITEIGSNQITMQGVPYPVMGISDTGDTQMMYPNEDYTYHGSSVTEYPMMKEGGALQLTKLDQLTNFTNYNTKQPGGWLDKYQD